MVRRAGQGAARWDGRNAANDGRNYSCFIIVETAATLRLGLDELQRSFFSETEKKQNQTV